MAFVFTGYDSAPKTTPGNASLTSVASSITSVTIRAANTSRRGLLIKNDSTANLYIAFNSVATTTAYTVSLAAGAYYELPLIGYTGIVTGIWDAANGFARTTELS